MNLQKGQVLLINMFSKKIYLLGLMAYLLTNNLTAYDFSALRLNIKHDLELNRINPDRIRIAIVFRTIQRDQLKKSMDLIHFKKEFAHQLLEDFQIADPSVINDIVKNNKLIPSKLKTRVELIKDFSDRASSNHVLFAEIEPFSEKVLLRTELISRNGLLISANKTSYFPSGPLTQSVPTLANGASLAQANTTIQTPTFGNTATISYQAPEVKDSQNNSWTHFAPTGYLIPEENAFNLTFWLKYLRNTDVPVKQLRYDYRLDSLQFGVQAYGSTKSTHHSSFASIKFQAIHERTLPLSLSLGLKYRLWRDNQNENFENDDEDLEEENINRNQIGLMAMVSGKADLLDTIFHLYLDNQTVSFGSNFSLTSNIKLFVDGITYYYQGDHEKFDSAIGVQFHSDTNSSFTLSYQTNTEQGLMGFQIGW